ncbi:hypothetical protein AcV7_005941 [Taiwanofungus camphoratus]|nr:hypothetical protein AcV7_005941 [Antrodia cinnamomea]
MAPIRLGFVGLSNQGWASWMLAPPLLKAPLSSDYTLAAISTSNPASASVSAEKYSKLANTTVKAYHGPTTAIAADKELDMVAVAVKVLDHKAAAIPVIEAGKSLFLEWPAGRDLKETREIAEVVSRKGVKAMVGLQGRQSVLIKKLKAIIESGEIGRVMSSTVTARPFRELFAWGPFIGQGGQYTARADSGATMLDVAVGHFLDSFTLVLGSFASVSAVVDNQYPTAELVDATGNPIGQTIEQTGANQVAVAGTLNSGAVVSLHWRGGLESKPGKTGTPFIWVIDGEKGSIRLESDDAAGSFIHIRDPTMYLNGEQVNVEEDGMTNPERAWFEFAKGPEGSYATLEDAVRNKTLLEAIKRSALEGKKVVL